MLSNGVRPSIEQVLEHPFLKNEDMLTQDESSERLLRMLN
jgi:hypothetical protein